MSAATLDFDLPMFAVAEPGVANAADPADAIRRIDEMTFEEMLRMVRCSPLSDPLFRGEVGKHFHATMRTRRGQLSPEDRAKVSKRVGW